MTPRGRHSLISGFHENRRFWRLALWHLIRNDGKWSPTATGRFYLQINIWDYFDGLVQEGRKSSTLAMELRLPYINPSIYTIWMKIRRNPPKRCIPVLCNLLRPKIPYIQSWYIERITMPGRMDNFTELFSVISFIPMFCVISILFIDMIVLKSSPVPYTWYDVPQLMCLNFTGFRFLLHCSNAINA